ncbi:cryptochrome/photolyase family protein [Kangiella sediminilitoris]|uniref:Deoxyribodipyrimidine photo-lyase n=1 Tax=Kangiella sediminilitoris TaxID=1144748 RepID=A0A1B3B839_9GAMM|nr:FAD-binding domain-containing protein [Kangiella sediminilitoris]AOE48962.1 deoxyribodipyrimidine photolyase [Kangiella sediminilitoris]
MTVSIVWFRQDIRVEDNPALHYAAKNGNVIGLYIEAEEQRKEHDESDAKVGLIYDSLLKLREQLNKLNIPLHIVKVETFKDQIKTLENWVDEVSAEGLYFNNEYPLNEKKRDNDVESRITKKGCRVERYDGDLAVEPSVIKNKQGEPYKVFTPYKKAWVEQHKTSRLKPLDAPQKQQYSIEKQVTDDFSKNYRDDIWHPGPIAAMERLQRFLGKVEEYKANRDIPSLSGTSLLSPYLAIGAISVRQCIFELYQHYNQDEGKLYGDKWLSELVWREFYRQILIDQPEITRHKPFNPDAKEVWVDNQEAFEAWKKGKTGFPIIDAAMRQLNQTGWMHNRLRMNAAMFLNKLCLVDWRWGEKYFMQQLIDGDFASNNGGWQWCSSTGADGAPYFRIMSPLSQSKRFDPEGDFIRKFVPELESLDKHSIHEPSDEQRTELDYPAPVIDYKESRKRALELLS